MPSEHKIPVITVGADPELFLWDHKKQMNISAHDLLPGTKENPFKVLYGAIQVDGTAAEFNIDPATSGDQFVGSCLQVMDAVKKHLPKGVVISIEPYVKYDREYWGTLPKETKALGCNPDFNAWTGVINPAPDRSDTPTLCTAAGHIHVGWGRGFDPKDPSHFGDCCIVAKQLDYFLGVPSLYWDEDPIRRKLYGKAGSFRPKPYGMEYRALSNKWLTDTYLMRWVWDRTYTAISSLFQGHIVEKTFTDQARTIIDNNIVDWKDKPEYKKLCTEVVLPLMWSGKTNKKIKPLVPGIKKEMY